MLFLLAQTVLFPYRCLDIFEESFSSLLNGQRLPLTRRHQVNPEGNRETGARIEEAENEIAGESPVQYREAARARLRHRIPSNRCLLSIDDPRRKC